MQAGGGGVQAQGSLGAGPGRRLSRSVLLRNPGRGSDGSPLRRRGARMQVHEGADDRRGREASWAQTELQRSPRGVRSFTEDEVLLCKVPRSLINLKLTYLSPLLLCYQRDTSV